MKHLFWIALCVPFISAGCISETGVQTQEEQVTEALLFGPASPDSPVGMRRIIDPSGIDMRLQATVAREFSNTYLDIAKDSARSRDALSAVVIGVAAYTGYGLIEGLSDTIVAERAVVGLAINEGADYASPRKATDALYVSARRMNCLGTQILMFSDLDTGSSVAARAVAWGAISEVRIQLREGLRREVPKYEDVFSRFKGAVANNLVFESGGGQSGRMGEFISAVEACLIAEQPEES